MSWELAIYADGPYLNSTWCRTAIAHLVKFTVVPCRTKKPERTSTVAAILLKKLVWFPAPHAKESLKRRSLSRYGLGTVRELAGTIWVQCESLSLKYSAAASASKSSSSWCPLRGAAKSKGFACRFQNLESIIYFIQQVCARTYKCIIFKSD